MRELLKILPEEGHIAFFLGNNTIKKTVWATIDSPSFLDKIDETIAYSIQNKCNCYFTPATFKPDSNNEYKKNNKSAEYIKCVFLDIDCHGSNEEEFYNTLEDAVNAFDEVCKKTDLYPNYLIYSGNGIQPVWVLSGKIDISQWKELNALLFDVFKGFGLLLDKNVRSDPSKMLRVPSSVNIRWKMKVGIEKTDEDDYNAITLFNRLNRIISENKIIVSKNDPVERKSELSNPPDFADVNYNHKLLEWFLETIPSDFSDKDTVGGVSSYQMWVNTIWAIKNTGFDNAWDAAVNWAKRSADKYPDWEDALLKVWNTDDNSKDTNSKISARSLKYIFMFYFPDKTVGKRYNFIAIGKSAKVGNTILNPGSPKAELPYPFTRVENRKGVYYIKESGRDDLPSINVLFVDRDIELLGIVAPSPNTVDIPVFEIRLRIHPSLYGDTSFDIKIPSSYLEDEKLLAKTFSGCCVVPKINKKWSIMSRYLNSLIDEHRNRNKPQYIVEQSGWNKDNSAFNLGSYAIHPNEITRLEIPQQISRVIKGIGETNGDLVTYLKILNTFNTNDHLIQQAIMLFMLGAPLCKFSPDKAATVYTYDRLTGTGKTFAHRMGLSFFGNPEAMMFGGNSTLNAIDQARMRYSDVPIYIDEFQISPNKKLNGKSLVECKDFLLRSSSGLEKERSSRDGQTFVGKGLTWHSPLFVSCNIPFSILIESDYTSQAATYARVLLIDYSNYMKNSPQRAYIDDEDIGLLLKKNYGHIGKHFLGHILNNKSYYMDKISKNYRLLADKSNQIGKMDQHRFHNTTIACGLSALEYLNEFNMIPNWDVGILKEFMPTLASTTNDDIDNLIVNNSELLFNRFIAEQTRYTLEADRVNEAPKDILLPNNKSYIDIFNIVIFRKDRICWIKITALKAFCKEYNADYRRLMSYMKTDPKVGIITRERVDFTKFAKNLNSDIADVVVVPLKAVRPSLLANEFTSKERGSIASI